MGDSPWVSLCIPARAARPLRNRTVLLPRLAVLHARLRKDAVRGPLGVPGSGGRSVEASRPYWEVALSVSFCIPPPVRQYMYSKRNLQHAWQTPELLYCGIR